MIPRLAKPEDFGAIVALYRMYTHVHDPLDDEVLMRKRWAELLDQPGAFVCVGDHNGLLVSTCTLSITPQLTRSGRSYGLIENVITHDRHRRAGHGRATLQFALQTAWANGCYKVMLLADSDNAEGRAFYRRVGFQDSKTGFVIYDTQNPV